MVHNQTVCEEIANDAIVRAVESAEKYKPSNFEGWLFSIAANYARHHLRHLKTHRKHEEQNFGRPTVLYRDAFAESITTEALGMFDEGVMNLTEPQRRALLLRVIDHLDYRQIGVIMNMKPGACRALIHRAKASLREWAQYMRAV